MAIPKYDELMKPFLQTLADGEVHRLKDINTKLTDEFHLTQEELSEILPSGADTVFRNRVGWARTYLKKAGLIESPARASFRITTEGLKVIQDNPAQIDRSYLEQFDSFKEFLNVGTDDSAKEPSNQEQADLTPDDQLEAAYQQLNDTLASDLLAEVVKLSPGAFEKFVVDLLVRMGYGKVTYGSHSTVLSGDEGIDGIIMEDKLGFSLIYMQAKKWAPDSTVSRPVIQGFVGAIAGKHGNGLFVTTARFSEKAVQYAEQHHIILVDGKKLARLMIESNFCVHTRRSLEIKEIDTDELSRYQDE